MKTNTKNRDLWILIIVSFMALCANLPDELLGKLLDRNLLLVTLVVTVFISLFRYLKFMLFLSVSVLAIGANLPDQLATQLGISRTAMIVASGLLVVMALLYKFYHKRSSAIASEPEDSESESESVAISTSRDTIEYRIAVVSAILNGDLAALHQLLISGAEINFSQNGHIPLFLAIEKGHAEIALLLLIHGAKLQVRNKIGITPIEFCLKHGNERIQNLMFYAARQNLAIQNRTVFSNPYKKKMVVLFADICGSTALYDQLGNETAFNVITRTLNTLIQEVASHKGTLVKTIGDEIMCTFPTVSLATRAARAMQHAVDRRHSTGEHAVHVRIGYHYGEVIHKANDVFGDTVNVASRIAAITRARQIMTSQLVVEALPEEHMDTVRPITRTALKGKQDAIHVFEILWEREASIVGRIGASVFRKRMDDTDRLPIVALASTQTADPTAPETLQ